MRLPLIAVSITLICSLLIDFCIWHDIRRGCRSMHFSGRRRCISAYWVSTVLCWGLLLTVVFMPKRGESSIIPLMWMLYAYISIYIPKLIYVLFSLIGRLPSLWHGKSIKLGKYVGLPIGIIVFAAIWWGATGGRRAIQTNVVEMASPKIPEAFDGYRIVQFSDLHVGTWGADTAFVSRFVDSINSLRPDLIVFTGDIVNRCTDEIKPFVPALSRLSAKDGVYSVLGNHDYGDYMDWKSQADHERNNAEMRSIQARMGWTMLNNDHCFLKADNDSILLIGVENWGEPPFRQYGRLEDAYPPIAASAQNANDRKFKILLSHNPEHWRQEVSKNTNIDLTLSGHTHAMQFIVSAKNWRWSPSQYRYEQWGGMYEAASPDGRPSRIYVNIGSGEVGMPYRIGADSEITLITLKHAPR